MHIREASLESVDELGESSSFPLVSLSQTLNQLSRNLAISARDRSPEDGGPLAGLRFLSLEQAVAASVDDPDVEEGSAVPPPWLIHYLVSRNVYLD